jgi:flagellar hook-length control protein FliK
MPEKMAYTPTELSSTEDSADFMPAKNAQQNAAAQTTSLEENPTGKALPGSSKESTASLMPEKMAYTQTELSSTEDSADFMPAKNAQQNAAAQTTSLEEHTTGKATPASIIHGTSKESTVSQMLSKIANPTAGRANNATEALGPNAAPIFSQIAVPQSRPFSYAPTQPQPQPAITSDSVANSADGQLPAGGSLQFTEKALDPGNAGANTNTIVLDQATGSLSTAAESGTPLPEQGADQESSLVVQNKYGQIITIEQNKESSLSPIVAGGLTNTRLVHRDPTNFDLNNRYIHSQLPHGTTNQAPDSTDNATTSNEQSQSSLFNGNNQNLDGFNTTAQQFAIKEGTGLPQAPQNISFNYQPSSSLTGLATPTSTEIGSALYRLGSGNLVPEGAVVDQMITHFSTNKRLETGSVNLKLYPQELGELRMEIKVDQDNVKAHIVAQSPHAQEMIDRQIPRLREALEQQGLHLQQIEVTVAANDNAAGERFQGNTAWQQARHSTPPKTTHTNFDLELEEEVVESDSVNNNLNVIA